MASQRTKQIYQFDETARTHLTRITYIHRWADLEDSERSLFKNATDDTRALETQETIFYVQGGGQPTDTGLINGTNESQKDVKFNVEAVRYGVDGRILHFGTYKHGSLSPGDLIEQQIDGARRDQNSKVHTAGHIIALSVRQLAQATPELQVTELKAQHYPDASFVEFKGVIDSKFKDDIQAKSMDHVDRALPIKIFSCRPDELSDNGVITAEGMPIVAGSDGKVRVVDIVGLGAYPCGGTHVPHTQHVGSIIIKGIKRQKGISKISYTIAAKQP